MRIYIPTLGRHNKQITFHNLPRELQEKAVLVVDDSEKDLYPHYENLLTLPSSCNSIGKVRQFIIDNHNTAKYGPKLIMLDDDLGFNMRRSDIRSKFLPATPEAIIEGFTEVEELLDKYAHGAIRYRQMSQDAQDVEYNCRTLRALAYNTDVLKENAISFDRLIVMEDFDVTLQLLRKGYENFSVSTLIQGQSSSNAEGGCSLYRDAARQAEGAYGLAELHPGFVKVRTKPTNWSGWGSKERVDVTIFWKKAFESSRKDV